MLEAASVNFKAGGLLGDTPWLVRIGRSHNCFKYCHEIFNILIYIGIRPSELDVQSTFVEMSRSATTGHHAPRYVWATSRWNHNVCVTSWGITSSNLGVTSSRKSRYYWSASMPSSRWESTTFFLNNFGLNAYAETDFITTFRDNMRISPWPDVRVVGSWTRSHA